MEHIGIETTQNVYIQQEPAGVGERMLSQILDFVFLFAYFLLIAFLISVLKFSGKGSSAIMWILMLPAFFYSFLCEIFFHGQSLAKMIMKIKVVKLDGSQPSIGGYFMRWIFRIVDVYFFYGAVAIVTIIMNGKGQRFGDMVAKTTVIKIKRNVGLQNTILVQLPETYQLVFEDVRKLSENDIKIIHEVLLNYNKNFNRLAIDMVNEAAKAIERKTGITHNLHQVTFLQTVIKDYNYLNLVNSVSTN